MCRRSLQASLWLHGLAYHKFIKIFIYHRYFMMKKYAFIFDKSLCSPAFLYYRLLNPGPSLHSRPHAPRRF